MQDSNEKETKEDQDCTG